MMSCHSNHSTDEEVAVWTPLGNAIPLYTKGSVRSDFKEMYISKTGHTLAMIDHFEPLDSVLRPKKITTFALKDTLWTPFGNKNKDTTYLTNAQNYAMNSSATRMVTGILTDDQQRIQTFDYQGQYWTLAHDTLVDRKPDALGWIQNVTLSGDGKTLILSSPVLVNSDAEMQAYSWTTKGWVPKGGRISIKKKAALHYGGADFFWNNVNVNYDGSIITIANVYNYDNGPDAGQVKVLQYVNRSWQQLGNDINGDLPYQHLGIAVHIGQDNQSLFITSSGRKRKDRYIRYTLKKNKWIRHKNDIPDAFFEYPLLQLSDDGTILLVSTDYEEYSENTYTIDLYSRTADGWKTIGRIEKNRGFVREFMMDEQQTRVFILFDHYRSKQIKVFSKTSFTK